MACTQKRAPALKGNATVEAIFDATEQEGLETILDFFETQICGLANVHRDSITNCYGMFFGSIRNARRKGMLYVPIQFPAQEAMYTRLTPELFSEIWVLGRGVDQTTGESVSRISLNAEGKYLLLLQRLRNKYASLDSYVQSFQEEKRLSSAMIESVMTDDDRFNINDPAVRLFLAVHYLTINDIYERKSIASGSRGDDQ
jgi:hypothetical protein